MNITDSLIRILHELSVSPLPKKVDLEARKCVMDQLGATLGGMQEVKGQFQAFLAFQPPVSDGASVIGLGTQATMEHAALAGGFAGHVFDIDDGNRFSTVHLGATIIPAVLAVSDYRGLTMEDMNRGVVIGYEAATRMGRAAQPSHRLRGFHASGTCGCIGAALGCAAALGFSESEMKSVLSAAVATASGLLEMQENVSKLKPYNVGHAAMNGVTAVSMACAGFIGPHDPLGGERGFFRALTDAFQTTPLTEAANGHYSIMDAYHKPYAACRHCHAAIDSALALRRELGEDISKIERITIRMYQQGMNGHDHTEISSVVSAKMSIPFSVALALCTGFAGISGFTEENIQNREILDLTKKTEVLLDKDLSDLVPKLRPVILELHMTDGTTRKKRTDLALGEPETPMTKEAFSAKFVDLALYGGKSRVEAEALCTEILTGTGRVAALTEKL